MGCSTAEWYSLLKSQLMWSSTLYIILISIRDPRGYRGTACWSPHLVLPWLYPHAFPTAWAVLLLQCTPIDQHMHRPSLDSQKTPMYQNQRTHALASLILCLHFHQMRRCALCRSCQPVRTCTPAVLPGKKAGNATGSPKPCWNCARYGNTCMQLDAVSIAVLEYFLSVVDPTTEPC
jgi:hypothetical protein